MKVYCGDLNCIYISLASEICHVVWIRNLHDPLSEFLSLIHFVAIYLSPALLTMPKPLVTQTERNLSYLEPLHKSGFVFVMNCILPSLPCDL